MKIQKPVGLEDAVLDGSSLLRAFPVSVYSRTSHEHLGSILQGGGESGFIQHVASGQINSDFLAKFLLAESFASSLLWLRFGRPQLSSVQGGCAYTDTCKKER